MAGRRILLGPKPLVKLLKQLTVRLNAHHMLATTTLSNSGLQTTVVPGHEKLCWEEMLRVGSAIMAAYYPTRPSYFRKRAHRTNVQRIEIKTSIEEQHAIALRAFKRSVGELDSAIDHNVTTDLPGILMKMAKVMLLFEATATLRQMQIDKKAFVQEHFFGKGKKHRFF